MLRDQIKPYIAKIVTREVTSRAVAKELGVAEETVSRMLKTLKVVKDPAPDHKAQQELNAARKAFRIEMANTRSIEEAAAAANCSTRTIYRLRKKS